MGKTWWVEVGMPRPQVYTVQAESEEAAVDAALAEHSAQAPHEWVGEVKLRPARRTFGAVQIDAEGSWFLPREWEDVTDEALQAAYDLTYDPPHGIDGGYGGRALADIRAHIGEVLEDRGLLAP